MIAKEKMLQILSKYGLDLNGCAPFFYEQDGKEGLIYQFSHEYYGLLTRFFSANTERELEDFVYQYWWYQNYANLYEVNIVLDNYESFLATPHFVRMGKRLSSKDMKDLLSKPDYFLEEQKNAKIFYKLLRTANLLLEIMKLKYQVVLDTSESVWELKKEQGRQENEFEQLFYRYKKINKTISSSDKKRPEVLKKPNFLGWKEDLKRIEKQEDITELKLFIETLWNHLKEIEMNTSYLKNKHALIKLPLILEDIRKKKIYMESLFNKKKGLFQKKVEPDIELNRIDEESETKKIVSENEYIANELRRLSDKYSIISEMDYATLGDYINDFDNMGIALPIIRDTDLTRHAISREDFLKRMEEIERNLTNHEKHCLTIYHSFLEPICDAVMALLLQNTDDNIIVKKVLKDYKEDIMDSMLHLQDAENVFIRMQQMKVLNLSSSEEFVNSLIFVCKTLITMKQFYVPGVITVFGRSSKDDLNISLYHANFNSMKAPTQHFGNNEMHDIIELKERIPFLYFSKYYDFHDPFFHDYTLEAEPREDVLLLLKDYHVDFSKAVIIKVARYKIEQQSGKDVLKVGMENVSEYRHLTVTF